MAEPVMYRRAYGGHLNTRQCLTPPSLAAGSGGGAAAATSAVPAAPQLAFLGARSGACVCVCLVCV